MASVDEILARCSNVLPGHGPERTLKATLQALTDSLTGDEDVDSYGQGADLAAFEAEMAELFGKEAAVFMPSGTMAQQIALRIWCDQRHMLTVAMHPTAHPDFAEHQGYRRLHGLQRLQFGAPEFLDNRMLTVADFEALGEVPGAILLELPYRPLGGELPAWEELVALRDWATAREIPLHMDGARIWACRPFYEKRYREIAAFFDSVYISFYKDLGGLAGAMLLGPATFVQAARIWQVRHGGRLRTMAPFVTAARLGYQRVVPQIDRWVSKTRAIADVMVGFDRVTIRPDPPHVNMFQLYIRGDAATLTEKHHALAVETGTFLFYGLQPSRVPGVAMTEIHCWENAATFDLAPLPFFLDRLLG